MDVLSIPEMMEREQAAFTDGTTAERLMEAAGETMAACIAVAFLRADDFLVLVGKGNNGGDGLVVARCLAKEGQPVRIALTADEDKLGELPQSRLARLREECPDVKIAPWSDDLPLPGSNGVAIDALLGVQAKGELRGELSGVVAKLNAARAARFFRTVALDLPTGLAAYADGSAPKDRDAAVVADVTLAVGFAKDVLCREALAGWVGRLAGRAMVGRAGGGKGRAPGARAARAGRAVAAPRGRYLVQERFRQAGHRGRAASASPARRYSGVQAAQAIGAGLLSVVTHEECAGASSPRTRRPRRWCPPGRSRETPEVVTGASVIAIGPGLGTRRPGARHAAQAVLDVGCPVLVDADGLTLLAKNPHLLRRGERAGGADPARRRDGAG